VSHDLFAGRPAGARPLADAPVEALVARADELARRWAVSLVGARALRELAEVPLQEVAREAPGLCAQLARALSSEVELAQLASVAGAPGSGGRDRAGPPLAWIARAGGAASLVGDVEALRGVIWQAALSELGDPSPRLVADLSDRLAFVCASLLAAVLAWHEAGAGPAPPAAWAPGGRERILYASPQTAGASRRAVLIDEREEGVVVATRAIATPAADRAAERASTERSSADAPGARAPADARRDRADHPKMPPRARPWDTPLTGEAERDVGPRPRAGADAQAGVRITRGPGSPVQDRP
jgi:hypothetical protein